MPLFFVDQIVLLFYFKWCETKLVGVNNPPQSPKGGFAPRAFKKLDGYELHKTNPKRKRDGKYHTPEHNGEVEGPHRIDQGKFYRYLTFYSLEDLRLQGARWNTKYNKTPRMTLKMKPSQPSRI